MEPTPTWQRAYDRSVSSCQVLVVDDDESIRESVGMVLRDEGFLVAEARDGREALTWLRAHPGRAKVILLDLMMPVLDGEGFLKVKEQDPLLAELPVVVITAGGGCRALRRSHKVRECLPKPVSMTRLIHAVRACVGAAP